jgi:polyhydroxyalkanoate synthesis regulator phasin
MTDVMEWLERLDEGLAYAINVKSTGTSAQNCVEELVCDYELDYDSARRIVDDVYSY